MIIQISENAVDELQCHLPDVSKYNYIYISFGSRRNEPFVQLGNNKLCTNAHFQMCPAFLEKSNMSSLLIMIDVFKTQNSIDNHVNNMKNILTENMDFFIINQRCNNVFVEEFMTLILDKLERVNFPNNHFMVSNFIRYKNTPNSLEEELEKSVPRSIQHILDMSDHYTHCFTQWFGYRYLFYDYLYNYKTLHVHPSIYSNIHEVETLLQKISNKTIQNKIVVQNPNVVFILKHMYNFCQLSDIRDTIYASLYDELISDETIVVVN